MTQVGHIACQSMRLDETHTMPPRPRLYLDSVRSYWCKCFRDLWGRHIWWRHMALSGVTGQQLHLIHCGIAFESSRIARFIMDVENKWKDPQQRIFASNGSRHDLDEKVTAQQPNVIETSTSRPYVKTVESKLCKKSDVYRKECSVSPR